MAATNPLVANKAQKLLDQAYDLRISNLTESKNLASQALRLSRELDDPDLIGKSLSHLALFSMIMGEYEASVKTAKESISHFEKAENEKGIADAKYSIAGAQYKTDNFHQGLATLIDCLSIYRKFKDHHNQARVLKSMGTIYEYFGDQRKAIESYEQAIEAAGEAGEIDLQSNAYNPLSGIYLDNGEIEKAFQMIEQSVQLKEKSGDIRGLGFSLYGRGKVYTTLGQFEKAEADFLRSIEIHESMGEKLGVVMSNRKLGSLYKENGMYQKAKEALQKAYDFSEAHNIVLIKFKACYGLYELAKLEGRTADAIDYLEKYIRDKESVINVRALKIIESYDNIVKMENLEREAVIQRERAEIIEQKNQDLDSFFYRISHDLKGPITSLIGLEYRVREEIKDPKVHGYLDEYNAQVMRMNMILDELIKITKIDHEDAIKKEIEFEQMIRACIESFHYFPNFSKINFQVHVMEGLHFQAEWSLINTILQNLIENAIKYSSPERAPIVTIAVKETEVLEITVSDNGIGMTEEVKSKIFQMFYQGNPKLRGTGLGLYILKRAVEKINGQIDVATKENKGSTFKIRIPKS